ncbi:DUF6054 family protein [Psychrobacillus lasiicapitis]|uniref:Uncharacterized protein n=1 Tax=Psychrobacillus lasiicapitis TaxID=1636719 RepID=A0A544T6M9_9BACI|nr:DUF6054 family protein [Psychrobacillus lasiicapitis]TQR13099.1 hypothetical protein FG382_11250 [Psychrobacillus lasiicapitis]GGA34493.1 hypothetical protein GCM10011384_25280 [Psychrobacillus lasiicapitis]
MDIRDFYVSLEPKAALDILQQHVVQGSISGTLIDVYERVIGEHQVVVCVLEKYYMRTSNRASLTITIDNLENKTKVHAASSGAGSGAIFRFDWGAGGDFVNSVERALGEYIL